MIELYDVFGLVWSLERAPPWARDCDGLLTDGSLEPSYLSQTVIPRVIKTRLESLPHGIVFGTGGSLALRAGGR